MGIFADDVSFRILDIFLASSAVKMLIRASNDRDKLSDSNIISCCADSRKLKGRLVMGNIDSATNMSANIDPLVPQAVRKHRNHGAWDSKIVPELEPSGCGGGSIVTILIRKF